MLEDYEMGWRERDCMEAAIGLVDELELPVTLCRRKRPIAAHWATHTYSAAEIEHEFARCPDLNVGVVLSRRSGLMDVVTARGDGGQSEREFHELVDDVFLPTPSFSTGDAYHRFFLLDEGLESLDHPELSFGSISIIIGTPRVARHCLVPPSVSQGVQREWRLDFDDCDGRFERLPFYAVERIMAAHGGSARGRRRPAVARA